MNMKEKLGKLYNQYEDIVEQMELVVKETIDEFLKEYKYVASINIDMNSSGYLTEIEFEFYQTDMYRGGYTDETIDEYREDCRCALFSLFNTYGESLMMAMGYSLQHQCLGSNITFDRTEDYPAKMWGKYNRKMNLYESN